MPSTLRICSSNQWGFSTTSGGGIRGYQISTYRFPVRNSYRLCLKGQLTGLVVATREEADSLGLLYGYLVPYSRNSCGFVQSRSARKHGYKATDYRYLRRARNTWKKMEISS